MLSLVSANDDLTEMTNKFNNFAQDNTEAFASLAEAQTGLPDFLLLYSISVGQTCWFHLILSANQVH